MKKSNKLFSISALILVLAGFMFASTSVFSDEKKVENAAATADAADDKKKKKKGDEDEEPECE